MNADGQVIWNVTSSGDTQHVNWSYAIEQFLGIGHLYKHSFEKMVPEDLLETVAISVWMGLHG